MVLSVGLTPPENVEEIAEKFGIELTDHKFCKTNLDNPIETSRRGIFVSGAFQGPMDIPEAVVTASGASALSSQLLAKRRGKLAKERVYPIERDVSGEELRIGVFVCACGANIGRTVDVPAVVEYAATLPNVIHAQKSLFACSTENASQIADAIREKGLNRVVVAACTPRTHEPTFRETLRQGGINQYFFDMANIREHDSWVHTQDKEEATQKAKDIVRMSVARTAELQPLVDIELPVDKRGLVVGGGLAGMTAALSLAEQGFEVYLVEKEKELGGMARRIHYTLEGMDVQATLADITRKVYQNTSIHKITGATITEASGYVGNFVTKVESEGRVREIHHGITIIATGADEYKPAEYLYGKDDRVLTLLELEEKIAKGDENVANAQSVVMIQCVGCRQKDRNYCARICCSQAVKNALKLKEMNPEKDVYIIYRDIRTYGFREDYYREAADKEVKFIRYEPDDKPQVEVIEQGDKRVLRITAFDFIMGKKIALDTDLLALAAAVIPSATTNAVSKLFKVPLSPDGFLQEAHVKLRPVDTSAEGVFLCGLAHYPKHIQEAVSQAYGAAGKAADIIANKSVIAPGSICDVNEKKCIACGACISACTYGAIKFVDTPKGKKAQVNPILCKGDGVCNAKCPTAAIFCNHFTNEEINAQIDASAPAPAVTPTWVQIPALAAAR